MKNEMKQNQNRSKRNRLAALLCVSLLLLGCGSSVNPEASDETAGNEAYADQVLEVGILADCSDPYAVVTYESFVAEAGRSEETIVVELHDCREGYEARMEGLETVKETGIDVLLMDWMDVEPEEALREQIAETIEALDVPVYFFGPRNPMDLLGIGGSYVGLSPEEAFAYANAKAENRFDESGYREHAQKAGRVLFEQVRLEEAD